MEKRESMYKRGLRNVKLHRGRHKQTASIVDEMRKQQYRELNDILSPFWAWRNKSS